MDEHIETVRAALKRYRGLSGSLRYGGLRSDWQLAKKALDALDEIEEDYEPHQPALFVIEKGETTWRKGQ